MNPKPLIETVSATTPLPVTPASLVSLLSRARRRQPLNLTSSLSRLSPHLISRQFVTLSLWVFHLVALSVSHRAPAFASSEPVKQHLLPRVVVVVVFSTRCKFSGPI
ncbi:hypothetical protein Ahy_B02g058226 isoform A [Arachis hypogaea]|uniref:Uncharacterized protein n=1 Tax=Arachis hypogaea TaxID=3818 RepID=A0A445AE59_ARAHY|nr:hypothetical protein Ahy_B02g058226 isoform A [Arachis hypogaea]